MSICACTCILCIHTSIASHMYFSMCAIGGAHRKVCMAYGTIYKLCIKNVLKTCACTCVCTKTS